MGIPRSAIVVGRTYTDDKGGFRRVTGAGSEFVLYRGQTDGDCVQYVLVAKRRGPGSVGNVYNTTRKSFAAWAMAAHDGIQHGDDEAREPTEQRTVTQ